MKLPFVIYADFECFTETIDTCLPNENKSFTQKFQKHTLTTNFLQLNHFLQPSDIAICKPKLINYTARSEDDDRKRICTKFRTNNTRNLSKD